MKIAILGAGKQAYGALHYLYDKDYEEIKVVDQDETRARELK